MRIFIYEHLTATGAALGSSSLLREGRAMLSAVVEDFALLAGTTVLTMTPERPGGHNAQQAEEATFKRLARKADFTLVIAPEFDAALATRCRWVGQAGGRLLGSAVDAIELTADKLRLAERFGSQAIPTPATREARKGDAALFFDKGAASPFILPCVIKPRYGAGSQATFLVRSPDDLLAALDQAGYEMPGSELILQSFAPGASISVAFLVGPKEIVPLLPCTQELSEDNRLRYRGGRAPVATEWADRALRLGHRAIEVVTGLSGYVGVDLVLGETAAGDAVIEINPRLTTSYVGLRRLARTNLAQVMLDVHSGHRIGQLGWDAGHVRFFPDGRIV